MKETEIDRLQRVFLKYKAHVGTPGPKLLRDRTLAPDTADKVLGIKIDGLRELRSWATEKARHTLEMSDSHRYNEAEFGHLLGPGEEYLRGLLGPDGLYSRIALELLYRANLTCDFWEQRIIAVCSPAFSKLAASEVSWMTTNSKQAPLITENHEPQLIAYMGCFPDEYLYRIYQGDEELGQLNDWPLGWTRTTDGEVQIDSRRPNVFERLAAEQQQGLWAKEDPRLARTYMISS